MTAILTEARPAYHPCYTDAKMLPAGTEIIITGFNAMDRMIAKTRTGFSLNVGVDECVESY
jgi:hypothetical protein